MICEHLRTLEQAILAQGLRETYRGKAWSDKCREWVYFDGYLDLPSIRTVFTLAPCIHDHIHRGTHDGQERGLVCMECYDALMGGYEPTAGGKVFRG